MTKNSDLSKKFKKFTFLMAVLIASFGLGSFVLAVWTEPTASPPSDNVAAPINVSTIDQVKPARLDVTALHDADDDSYYINPSATATPSGVFAGNVGIGTAIPQELLHVQGDPDLGNVPPHWYGGRALFEVNEMIVRDSSPQIKLETTRFGGVDNLNFRIVSFSDDKFHILSIKDDGTGNNNRMTIDGTNGNVGIGTNIPGKKLDVNGAIHSTGDICTDVGGVCLSTAGGGGGFWTENANDIYNNNTGNVGIGTMTPSAQLHLEGDSGSAAEIVLVHKGVGGSAGISFNVTNDPSNYAIKAYDNRLGFYIGPPAKRRMTILPSGNVGIGTSDPLVQLQLEGDSGSAAEIALVHNGVGGSAGISFDVTDDVSAFYIKSHGDRLKFAAGVGGIKMVMTPSGRIGIGTPDPLSKLHVLGDTPDNIPIDARISVQNTNAGSKKSELCFIRPDTGSNGWCIGTDFWSQNDDDFFIWGGGADGGADDGRLYIDSTGNVGIGTSSPSAKLEVDMKTSTSEGLHISRTATGPNSYFNIEDEVSNPVFKVHESGNVGIGTSDPDAFLHISGNDPEHEILIDSSGSAAIGMTTSSGTVDKNTKRIININDGWGNRFWIEDTDIDGAGTREKIISTKKVGSEYYVGIGDVSNPSQKLEVDGGVKLNTTSARPACNLTTRGTFWFIQGAVGVKDSVTVCAKEAGGAYAWRLIY